MPTLNVLFYVYTCVCACVNVACYVRERLVLVWGENRLFMFFFVIFDRIVYIMASTGRSMVVFLKTNVTLCNHLILIHHVLKSSNVLISDDSYQFI